MFHSFEKNNNIVSLKPLSALFFAIHDGCRGPVVKAFDLYAQGRGFNPQSRHGGVGQILL